MAKNARLSSESRWRQLTEALIEAGRNIKILEARVDALEQRAQSTAMVAEKGILGAWGAGPS